MPNKATIEIKEFATAILHRPEYVQSLRKRLDEGKAPHMETLLMHYAHGRPKETTAIEGEVRLKVTWEP